MPQPLTRMTLGIALLAAVALAPLPPGTFKPSPLSVQTAAGEVHGVWVPAERGATSFAAFLGIPYAQPPLGSLRYKAQAQVQEQEQANKQLLPVLVIIHGGAYHHGSGRLDFLGPHFLVMHDIVVVSFNYRLGPLGFLSLDTEDLPGNAGLKDMLLALHWVKQNVNAFGGDPARVTVLGYSTGLFTRGVLLSGHAISARAYTERHVERARTLATLLGARDNSTATVTGVLMGASVPDILAANEDPRMRVIGQPKPSPERRADGTEPKLVTQDPESLLRRPLREPIPLIVSVTGREGIYPFTMWGLQARPHAEVDALLPRFMPADLLPGRDTAALLGSAYSGGPGPLERDMALRLSRLVREEYSAGGSIAGDTDALLEFLSDSFILESTWRAVGFIANASTADAPLLLCRFLVDDKYAFIKKPNNVTVPGVAHADDLGYLFRFDRSPDLKQDLLDSGLAPQVLRRHTETIARFVKGASGWPAVRPGLLEPTSWPVWEEGPGQRRGVHHSAPGPHFAFWSSVYRDLRSSSSSLLAPLPSSSSQ